MPGPINVRTDVDASEEDLSLLAGLTAIPRNITFTPAAGEATHCSVTLQVVDANGDAVEEVFVFPVWISDAATGVGVSTTPDAIAALAGSGVDIITATITTKKAILAQTLADGSYVLDITEATAGEQATIYVAATIPGCPNSGRTAVSRILTADDFGS